MKDIKYKISFFSYWHTGGGNGISMEMDNAVIKDKNNLPYIGGKALKGLIKNSAQFIQKYQPKLVNEKFISEVFGEEDKSYENNKLIQNKFTSAHLREQVNYEFARSLFHKKHNTAIVKNKQAKPSSLRTMEATIPVELVACIENFTGDIEKLKLCFKALTKIGMKRFRGYGRCKVEIIENNAENV